MPASVPGTACAQRETSGVSQTSRSSGVRMAITWAAPGMGWPVSGSRSGCSTLAGLSSAPSTGSASSAVRIASSNPAVDGLPSSRWAARSTNPADTGTPNSMSISSAVFSVGTLP